ncbi:hypothetical protein LWI28_022779 [Acer negundo]|uniref:Uncharacterized protein n=1 Tax=Acer negundo TaxID=4023 RepID=A0AAD5P2X6_ACENE|nr:hypothetical protein LWI28_022779 [Acer negundo]
MYTQTCNIIKNIATKLDYSDNMFKLESNATLTVTSTSLYKMFNQKAELEFEKELEKGKKIVLHVDESGRKLNSRLHSAGHLMDAGHTLNIKLRHHKVNCKANQKN